MTGFKLLSAAFILSAGMATPVFAQAAISEPGAYAFYHPNGDLLGTGSSRPAPDAMAMAVPHSSVRIARQGARTLSHRVAAKRTDRRGM
jgi:hypothetical protein